MELKKNHKFYDAWPTYCGTANNRFKIVSLGTWTSVSQVDIFLSEYNVNNDYRGTSGTPLCLGNYVTIQDGTYNATWQIAGFDTFYYSGDTNSGRGIALIPMTYNSTMTGYMNSTDTTVGGYYNSYMCQTTLPAIANKLKNVLGSHMVNRRVSLSNAVSTDATVKMSISKGLSTGRGWYSEYLVLMSEIQAYGSSVFGGPIDTGEANRMLPLFKYYSPNSDRRDFWLRDVMSNTQFASLHGDGTSYFNHASESKWIRPILYIV